MAQKSYKAIGFDYGGVIAGKNTNGVPFARKVCDLLGISIDEFHQTYFSMNYLMQLGELDSWEEFWRRFLVKLGKGEEKLKDIVALNDEVESDLKVVDTRMLDLVDALRAKGYKLGLLSNTTVSGAADIRQLGVPAHFDVFHASSEVKHMKPHPETFRIFADALGVSQQDMIFIDDTERSLSTSEECGYTPILYTSYDNLIKELEKLDII